MGWTGVHKPKNVKTIDFLKSEWSGQTRYEIIDSAMRDFNSVFFAVRDKEKGYVFAVIYLVSFSNEYHNLHFKSMDEFAGPYRNCPKRILKLLTPLEEIVKIVGEEISDNGYSYAKRWREESAAQFVKNSDKSLKIGDIFRTEEPLEFKSGHKFQYFKKLKKNFYAIDPHNGFREIGLVKLTGLKKIEYKKLSTQEIGQFMRNEVPA